MLSVIILAAGKGTCMYSQLPKVLHILGDKPLLAHVIDTAYALNAANIYIVYGYQGEQVKQYFAKDQMLQWVEQKQQLGTGHAVQQALPLIPDDHQVVILYGDVPLISQNTLIALLSLIEKAPLAVLTALLEDPTGYGRIIRDHQENINSIIEQKDANQEQLKIKEINTGFLAAHAGFLKHCLAKVTNDNVQKEYYLTDVVALAVQEQAIVNTYITQDIIEISGVNNKLQLGLLERQYQKRLAKDLMLKGVMIKDLERIDIRGEVTFGQDVELEVGVILEGKITLGNHVRIGAYTIIRDSEIGDNTQILEHCSIHKAVIGAQNRIGPFARIRPETLLKDKVHIGNFVEVKKTTIDEGSKANHLTYLGDATIGKEVNIGAGTITCNYDGTNKYQTIIKDDVFIGSNSQLIAPVTIAKGSTIGAGSTITKDTPEDKLTLARARQVTIANWKRPEKKPKE